MKLLSYDLGASGVKASLYNQGLFTLSKSFIEYTTYFPKACMHEQKPSDWWKGISKSTRVLLEKTNTSPEEIGAIAISGHSLVVVPIDNTETTLIEQVPIWSDTRAVEEARIFFENIDSDK